MEIPDDLMVAKQYTSEDWLNFYRNNWTQKLIASTIDLQKNLDKEEADPNQKVMNRDGKLVSLSQDRALIKANLKIVLNILTAIEKLIVLKEEQLQEFFWSDECLNEFEKEKEERQVANFVKPPQDNVKE